MATAVKTRQTRENALFGVHSEIAELFREKGFEVLFYSESIDEMDIKVDKPDINLIVRGYADRQEFIDVIDKLPPQYRVVNQGNFCNVERGKEFNRFYYCLLDVGGKRIKIREQVEYN